MKRTQVYLTDKQYKEVKLISDTTGVKFSVLLREALDRELARRKKEDKEEKKNPLAELVGKYSFPDADPNAAINHNDIYDIDL